MTRSDNKKTGAANRGGPFTASIQLFLTLVMAGCLEKQLLIQKPNPLFDLRNGRRSEKLFFYVRMRVTNNVLFRMYFFLTFIKYVY